MHIPAAARIFAYRGDNLFSFASSRSPRRGIRRRSSFRSTSSQTEIAITGCARVKVTVTVTVERARARPRTRYHGSSRRRAYSRRNEIPRQGSKALRCAFASFRLRLCYSILHREAFRRNQDAGLMPRRDGTIPLSYESEFLRTTLFHPHSSACDLLISRVALIAREIDQRENPSCSTARRNCLRSYASELRSGTSDQGSPANLVPARIHARTRTMGLKCKFGPV